MKNPGITPLKCTECGEPTEMACADCAINSGAKNIVHVCGKTACQDAHEARAKCTPPGSIR